MVGETCPKCGEGTLAEKDGRFGKFISCDQYPTCKYIHKDTKNSETAQTTYSKPAAGGKTAQFAKAGASANWSGLAQSVITPFMLAEKEKWDWDEFQALLIERTDGLFAAKEESLKVLMSNG